jgi:hypothetical protein
MAITERESIKLKPFNDTFGLPPSSYVSDSMIINSMPVLEIHPGKPSFESGLTLFKVEDDFDTYANILGNLGYSLSSKPIKLAFIADNFPTDTFTNEYGETFLQKFTDVASSGMQQISQLTGSHTFSKAMEKLGTSFSGIGKDVGGAAGALIKGAGTGFKETGEGLLKLRSALSGNKLLGGAADLIDKMAGGARVDFPMIWRNSGYAPSYSVTVRLYNPNPGNSKSTNRHIIGPLAVILCLAIPRSKDGKTYNWPFFHKIYCRGIYGLDPSVITNITVIKGGDQQQISYNQKLAMVDVRIDFTSLYGTMVLEEKKTFEQQRPTVNNYLNSLLEDDPNLSRKRNQMRTAAASAAGGGILNGRSFISSLVPSDPALNNLLAKNQAAQRARSQTIIEKAVGSRVSSINSDLQARLVVNSPSDFIS